MPDSGVKPDLNDFKEFETSKQDAASQKVSLMTCLKVAIFSLKKSLFKMFMLLFMKTVSQVDTSQTHQDVHIKLMQHFLMSTTP